jgi:hypothetical protein
MINTSSQPNTNPNTSWLSLRGTWLTNVLIVVVLKVAFSLVPGMTPEVSWTLTNLTYNIVPALDDPWPAAS